MQQLRESSGSSVLFLFVEAWDVAIPLSVADAFTDRPYSGNPAAVCLPGEERPDLWLQDVAREMNLSEDPVTGSAYSCPGPCWKKPGKTIMTGVRASARAGIVRVELAG
jgi:predicted PhzF superfamily epimerase YddE/YHI9